MLYVFFSFSIYLLLCILLSYFFFFFSSRRRHTRYWRDWSSDVCSSDLWARSPSISAGATMGGTVASVPRTASRAARSGHCGCWAAGRSFHRSRPGTSSAGSGRLTPPRLRARTPPPPGTRRPAPGPCGGALGSSEEDLGLGVPLRRHELQLRGRGRQRHPHDVGAAQGDHHPRLPVVDGVDSRQTEAGREHPVER